MEEKKEKSKGVPIGLAKTILKLIDGMPTTAAVHVIDAYNQIPILIRDAFEEFYKAKSNVDGRDGISLLQKSLEQLKEVCRGSEYEEFYEIAKSEANQEIAELYANGVMSV